MMRVTLRPVLDCMTVAVIAVAMLLVTYAHHPVGRSPADLAAYAMPDGSLPELCLDASGSEGQHNPCPVCTLAVGDLQSAPPVAMHPMVLRPADRQGTARHLAMLPQPRAPPARGPPILI